MESGTETIERDGVSTFGTVELFGSANSNLGFELDQPATLAQTYENHKKSAEYLLQNF